MDLYKAVAAYVAEKRRVEGDEYPTDAELYYTNLPSLWTDLENALAEEKERRRK